MWVQRARKQLRRSQAECQALKAQLADLKRRDRTADLYKRKVSHLSQITLKVMASGQVAVQASPDKALHDLFTNSSCCVCGQGVINGLSLAP